MTIPPIPSYEGILRLLLDKTFAILLTPEQISQQVLTDGFGHKKE